MNDFLKWGSALLGATISFFFGEWSTALIVLIVLTMFDYGTGILSAAINQKLSSKIGYTGIARKTFVFVIVSIAHYADVLTGNQNNMFQQSTLFFYIANEMISILENAGKMGVPIPSILKKAIQIFQDKGGENP